MPQYVWPWLFAAALLSSVDADSSIRMAPQGKGIDGCYIVKFKDGTADEVRQNVIAKHPSNKGKDHKKFQMVTQCDMTDAEVQQLASAAEVVFVEQNAVVNATAFSWGIDRIDQDHLPLNNTYSPYGTGAGAVVYIMDTGFQLDHDQYKGRAFDFYDAVATNNKKPDVNCLSHGTMVAGIIGGKDYGVAHSASMYSVRVLGCDGSGDVGKLITSLYYILQSPVKSNTTSVINLSLGGPYSEALNDAVQVAFDSGFVVVVSAGNENTDASTHSPASAPAAITVGSTSVSDARSSFSNYGTSLDIFAPGENILTSAADHKTTSTAYLSGTSAAAPIVSGAAALFLGANSTASSAEVRNFVLSTAVQNVLTNVMESPNRLVHVQYSSTSTSPVLGECQSIASQYVDQYQSWESGPSPACTWDQVKQTLPKHCKVVKGDCYTIVCDSITETELSNIKSLCSA